MQSYRPKALLLLVTSLLISYLLLATNSISADQQQGEETFTITTYYPSPYGSYNELSTNKFAVGDADGDGKVTTTDQPNRDGDIRIKPQTGDPTTWSVGKEGEIAYSGVKDTLYVNNGSAWVSQGGGKTCYTKYNSSPGTCPSCPTGWTREDCLGVWGYCTYGTTGSYGGGFNVQPTSGYGYGYARDFPPGGGCPPTTVGYMNSPTGWSRYDIGQAALCCKE